MPYSIYLQDLPRTFPGHPWLDMESGHAALRRILVVYSFRDSYVGYCQVIHFKPFHDLLHLSFHLWLLISGCIIEGKLKAKCC